MDIEQKFQALTIAEIQNKTARQIRVYTDGVYDLFHFGHVEQLKQAKMTYDNVYLIVGVVTDEDSLKYKGGINVMTHAERIRSVELCEFVDEIITNPPFYPTLEFIDQLKIDLVAHDALPYKIVVDSKVIDDCYAPLKNAGRFLETTRTPKISTTDIVQRIVTRVEEYKERNKSRGILVDEVSDLLERM